MDKSPYWKPFIATAFIFTGMGSYYTSKMQNIQQFNGARFFHPYMQTLAMFIGQFLCLLIYLYFRKTDPQTYFQRQKEALKQGKKITINPLLLAIPATFDFLSSTLQYFALNFIPGSIWQMLAGGTVITTLLFSRILIRQQKIKTYQYVGCFLSFFGMMISGLSTLIFNGAQSNYDVGLQILGYIMFIISLFLSGAFYVIQQKILNNYYIQPLKIVGLQGIFGICLCIIFIPILTFIKCPFTSDSACVMAANGHYYFQRPDKYFKQIGQNPVLQAAVPLGIISIAFLNSNGVTVTKYIGATFRPLLVLIRTIVVWMIGIAVTATVGKVQGVYRWQQLDLKTVFLQIIGFMIIILGVNIYSTNIKLACLQQQKTEDVNKEVISQLLSNYDGQVNKTNKQKLLE